MKSKCSQTQKAVNEKVKNYNFKNNPVKTVENS